MRKKDTKLANKKVESVKFQVERYERSSERGNIKSNTSCRFQLRQYNGRAFLFFKKRESFGSLSASKP